MLWLVYFHNLNFLSVVILDRADRAISTEFYWETNMFQWKTKIPTRPSPPTPEQQKEDLENLRESILESHSLNSNGKSSVFFIHSNLLWLIKLFISDSESLDETDMQIAKYRKLVSNGLITEKIIQDLEVSLENLKETSKELVQLSQEVREKASTTISWILSILY